MTVENSIVLLTGTNPENAKFGTGFVIHADDDGVYVLTCRHVVQDVEAVAGGFVCINYHEHPVPELFVNSGDDPDDMAVLKIDGLKDKRPLAIAPAAAPGTAFRICGYYSSAKNEHRTLPLDGVLGEQGILNFKSRVGHLITWDLEIQGRRHLQPGYSGSPVLDAETNAVIGVVSHMLRKGEIGIAVCVSLLPEIWKDMPHGLLKPAIQKAGHPLEPGTDPIPESIQKAKPKRKKFAPVDPKMCNRDREDAQFRDFFIEHCRECPPIPLFIIIPGEEGECHNDLVERFRDTRVKPVIESFGKPEKSESITNKPWKMPWMLRPDMPDAGRRYTLREQLSQKFYVQTPPDPDQPLSDMFRSLNAAKYRAIILSHNIDAQDWDEDLMHWYITQFWQKDFMCEENDEMPLFLIFLNIVYPESDYQTRIQRFLWKWRHKKRITKQLNSLKTRCDEHNSRVLIFEELRGIRKKHVSQWFTKFGEGLMKKDKLDFIYEMFKNRSRVCMAEIEKELKRIVEENKQDQFRSERR